MSFTDKEKECLKVLVKKELNTIKNEEQNIVTDDNPSFLAMEERYEDFLEELLKKM